MDWTFPEYVESRVDAEIGSHQDDFDPMRQPSDLALKDADDAHIARASQ